MGEDMGRGFEELEMVKDEKGLSEEDIGSGVEG